MDEDLHNSGHAAPPAPASRSQLWRVVGVVALALSGVVAWFAVKAANHRAAAELVAQAQAALDAGDTATAHSRLLVAAQKDPERADLVFARGRLALAKGDDTLALKLLRRSAGVAAAEDWTGADRGRLALALADAEARAGELDRALQANDSGLARLTDLVDSHLDQDGLRGDGRSAGADASEAPGVVQGLALLAQRGRLAGRRAADLHSGGDTAAATRVLEAAETRISGTVCTGTHRVYCRGVRAELREKAMAPVRGARTRVRIDQALALVRKKQFDEAMDLANDAHEQAAEEAKRGPSPAAKAMAQDAAQVAYAVHVAWGQTLEEERAWGDARKQFEAAEKLWKAGQLAQAGVALEGGQPPHAAGLQRARTLDGLLDETDSTLDKAAALLAPVGGDKLGIGDAARRRFHDALKQRPLDPRTYAEEALTRVRAARVANSDTTVMTAVQAEAERYLDASQKVIPGDPMGRFYKGVLAFMAGYPKRGLDGMRAAYKAGYTGRAAELYLAETLSLRDQHGEALTHWKKALAADSADTYVGRRTVEALVAQGKVQEARKLVVRMLEERALDRDLIEAQVLVYLHARDHDALRKVLLFDRMHLSQDAPDAVKRSRRITDAVYNKLGDRVHTDIMRPGEELLDRLYAYSIPADGAHLAAKKRVQSAILVLTTQGLVVLRWDASKDYRKEIERGASLFKRASRVGLKLGGELAGLNVGDGLEKLAQLLDLLPESRSAKKPKESLLDSSVGLVIDSLELYDTVRGDFELSVQATDVRVHRIPKGSVVAWDLVPVDSDKGLYAVLARTRDGLSPWKTDSDRLLVQTDRPARLRAYLQHVLQAPAK